MSHCLPGTDGCSTSPSYGGWRPDGSNPCRHVKRFREEKRERFLSDAEYRCFGKTLKEIERDGSETPSAVPPLAC